MFLLEVGGIENAIFNLHKQLLLFVPQVIGQHVSFHFKMSMCSFKYNEESHFGFLKHEHRANRKSRLSSAIN